MTGTVQTLPGCVASKRIGGLCGRILTGPFLLQATGAGIAADARQGSVMKRFDLPAIVAGAALASLAWLGAGAAVADETSAKPAADAAAGGPFA
ncbi:MAG: hypothetical protein ISP90_16950, partial [Nevskia sp.]|nr:hypothetical protein [Nevskia sp.]